MNGKRLSVAAVTALLTLLWMTDGVRTRAQSNDEEYRIKAAFIFHFAQLVDWPENALQASSNAFYLCTFGTDPFRGALESTVAGKAIGGRVIQVRHLRQAGDVPGCQVLFLGQAEDKQIPGLLADMHNAPILTVGETPSFLRAGGMICFVLEQERVRFQINLTAAEAAKLKIGSRLLLLAQTVIGESRAK